MDHSPTPSAPRMTPHQNAGNRSSWIDAAIASGFIATIAMSFAMAIAYGMARAIGDRQGSTLQQWFAALSSNELMDRVGGGVFAALIVNLVLGLVWAVIYAVWFAGRLPGPGWQRGMIFSLIPWILSLVVFFPIAGLGLFGSDIGAGLLPTAGNLILHLIYGGVLGSLYRVTLRVATGDDIALGTDLRITPSGSRATTVGMLVGGIVGIVGGWLLAPSLESIAPQALIAFGGLLVGTAMGMTLGALAGMREDQAPAEHRA